jgi:hypothetical protein
MEVRGIMGKRRAIGNALQAPCHEIIGLELTGRKYMIV